MRHKLLSGAWLLAGTLALSTAAMAQHRGGGSFGGGHSFSAPRGYSGGHVFTGSRGFGGDFHYNRGFVGGGWYSRPAYRGYYRGGVGVYFGAPYYYVDPGYYYAPYYDPGYTYPPEVTYGPAPAPAPAVPQNCSPGGYDQYGNWVPNSNCVNQPQQYPQQPNYYPNQQPNGR
jgi:hypothetical protein